MIAPFDSFYATKKQILGCNHVGLRYANPTYELRATTVNC